MTIFSCCIRTNGRRAVEEEKFVDKKSDSFLRPFCVYTAHKICIANFRKFNEEKSPP